MTTDRQEGGVTADRVWRVVIKLSLAFIGVYLAKLGIDALMAKIVLFESDAAARAMTGLFITVMIAYVILLAIPFVPGVEIGIAILLLQGAAAAPYVYLATTLGLFLAFCVGQYAPLPRLIRFFQDLSFARIAVFLQSIAQTPRQKRLDAMHNRLPKWLAAALCNYRYVTLAIAINLPGNIVLGGGGGIMVAGGLSRLFQTGAMFVTLLIATLPVPLSVWLLGTDVLR